MHFFWCYTQIYEDFLFFWQPLKLREADTSTKISHVYFGMQSAAEIQNCAHMQVKIRMEKKMACRGVFEIRFLGGILRKVFK